MTPVCERVQRAVVDGEALDEELRTHAETCDDCRFLAELSSGLADEGRRAAEDRTGELVDGKYRLVRMLGSGGMGSVYAADHIAIGKQVALKFLHRELAANTAVVARFLQEARAAASIGSRAIIEVFDVGKAGDGSPFIVMELLDGESLRGTMLRRGPLPIDLTLSVIGPLLTALSAAHDKGIVHRDLKPDNVFLEKTAPGAPPSVKLLDFGIAKMTEGAVAPATRTGMTMGTPHYMPPEQARGERGLDRRVDLYAVGVILYEALTGVCPFEGDNYNALLVRILTERPRAPRQLRPDLPAGLEAVIVRAIAKDPAERYQSADEMLAALEPYHAAGAGSVPPTRATPAPKGEPSSVASIPATESPVAAGLPAGRPDRRLAAALTAILLLGGAAAIGWTQMRSASHPVVRTTGLTQPAPVIEAPAASRSVVDPAATTVQPISIAIEGAPAGARILFDGAEVTQLPIRVMPRGVMVPLRVEAQGHVPFSRMLSLDRDLVVQVEMPAVQLPSAPAVVHHGRNPPVGAGLSKTTTPVTTSPDAPEKRPPAKRFLTDTSEFGGTQ